MIIGTLEEIPIAGACRSTIPRISHFTQARTFVDEQTREPQIARAATLF
jgi:hypothetical protein